MDKVIISKLRKDDISQAAKLIIPLYNTMLENRKDIFIPKEENWEEYINNRINNENFVLLAAYVDSNIVGVCTCEIKHCGDGVETYTRDILFIDYIAVNEKYRRLKIGTKLLNETKRIAKENNISTVELNVWGFNESAINFYDNNDMKVKRIVYEYLIDR